jgi:hypothetical protein
MMASGQKHGSGENDNAIGTPTKQQYALVAFAAWCEETGFRPAHYYRLTEQISAARAAVNKFEAKK